MSREIFRLFLMVFLVAVFIFFAWVTRYHYHPKEVGVRFDRWTGEMQTYHADIPAWVPYQRH